MTTMIFKRLCFCGLALVSGSLFAYKDPSIAYQKEAFQSAQEEGMSINPKTNPKNLNMMATIEQRHGLALLKSALEEAGLTDMIKNGEHITLFAPRNQAFKNMEDNQFEELMNGHAAELKNILLYHIVKESINTDDLKEPKTYQTAMGKKITLTARGLKERTVHVNDAQIINKFDTANGTIYIIDEVLSPE